MVRNEASTSARSAKGVSLSDFKEKKLAGRVVAIERVDRFPKGAVVEVPERQGEHLVALGVAERAE